MLQIDPEQRASAQDLIRDENPVAHDDGAEAMSPLVRQKLEDPNLDLTMDQSLECLDSCIKMGEAAVHKTKGKQVLAVIGNTGSGKSTLINFLHGCDMETTKVEISGQTKTVVGVKPDSDIPTLMEIGHSNLSKTFLPDVGCGDRFVYVDCPVSI